MFTLRNNLDKPGVSNEAPAVTKHCSPVTLKDGRIVFEPAALAGVADRPRSRRSEQVTLTSLLLAVPTMRAQE